MTLSKYCRATLHDTCTGFIDLKKECTCDCHEKEESDSFWKIK